jgi:hypothetical protein
MTFAGCFLTFWHPSGRESGPWLPHDMATINTLNTNFLQSNP